MLTCNEVARDESGDQWSFCEPEDVCSEYFWALYKTNGIGRDSDEITEKDRCID